MAYKHHVNTYKKGKQARRLRNFAIASSVLVMVAVAAVAADWVREQSSDSNTVVTRETTSSVQAASVSVYRSPYFQFQAPDEWVTVTALTTDDTFVFVKNRQQLIEERLVVHVNRPETKIDQDLKLTYALPVEVGVDGTFENIGKVSSHCDESWPDGLKGNPTRIEHEDIRFVCSKGSVQYNVVFGEEGDDENIVVNLRDGTQATLTVVYSNLTASPSPGDIYTIAESFSTL